MPNFFSRFLARLSVGRKLLLIYLLDLTAVIYISGILINEKFIAIDFARKEVAGLAYIGVAREAVIDIARSGIGGDDFRAPWPAHAQALGEAEAAHGPAMGSASLNAAWVAKLRTLGAEPASPATLASLLDNGRELITRVGNQSNLILDPDLDSYYSMSLVLLRYPELLGVMDRIGARLSAPAGGAGGDLRTQYLVLEGQLDATAHGIASDQAEAVAASGPALRAALHPAQVRLAERIEALRRAARAYIDQGTSPRTLADVQAAQRALVLELHGAWRVGQQELERLLHERIAGLYTRMWLHLGTALVLLLAILSLVYWVAQQIATPLRHLSGVADTVRRSGDHTLRAHWSSEDEIGRLVLAFNDMLAQLDREREAQKELAASARAAEAQSALVESTPIPLVVTSVPGHEVLHANPPAEPWLNGRRNDPWAAGLEPAVRARFFQQLADRDAVHEFEVQWRGGAEPAWAVLSARRLLYHGQPAVITAFAPINHMKLLERRLELWAKVYEATSEGILIVDAEQNVLSANPAFYRSTGYDLNEVVREPVERLLGADLGEAFFTTLWTTVRRRGTWQGELVVRRRNGGHYPAWLVVSVVRPGQGEQRQPTHYIFSCIDISERKKNEQRIEFLAQHDVLTSLPNRSLCIERLRLALQQAARSGRSVAVLFIDLDRFKDINDSLGHHVGDGLLRSVAQRLIEAVRVGDTVSRLGGDEFVVVLNGVDDSNEAATIVEQRLIPLIRQPHLVEGTELRVSCSVGIALAPEDATDIDTLMRHADTAMYQAKASGRNTSQFFTAEMTERAQARHRLEASLRRAVEQREFRLHYQPRIDAASGRCIGVEALLRWRCVELGEVGPAQFIPVAEECGLIVAIGAWVIEEACRHIAQWRSDGHPALGVSINLSALQLHDAGLLEALSDSLQRHAVAPGLLELELTESTLMDDAESNLQVMHAIRALGVGLAVDDFGTGYSSLNYLNRFPIDKLKIDRSFVHGMQADGTHHAITMAIIGLGHTLGLKVVAEGVETEQEAQALRTARCDELQGYHFARPMAAEALSAWLDERATSVA